MSAAPVAKRRAGRPVRWTPATIRRLLRTIGRGVPFRHACAALGVSISRFCELRNEDPAFHAKVDSAVSRAVDKRLRVIQNAANGGDWRAAEAWLRLVLPAEYGRQRLELSGVDGGPLAQVAVVLQWPHQQTGQPSNQIQDHDADYHLTKTSPRTN
jgi:hypothetical protein